MCHYTQYVEFLFNTLRRQTEADLHVSVAILFYIKSYRAARATKKDPVSKEKGKGKKRVKQIFLKLLTLFNIIAKQVTLVENKGTKER